MEQEKIPLKEFLGEEFFGYKGQSAIDKLFEEKRGHIKNAFYREDIGYITLAWGNEEKGLCHMIVRRKSQDIEILDFLSNLADVIEKGNLHENKKNKNRRNILVRRENDCCRDNILR